MELKFELPDPNKVYNHGSFAKTNIIEALPGIDKDNQPQIHVEFAGLSTKDCRLLITKEQFGMLINVLNSRNSKKLKVFFFGFMSVSYYDRLCLDICEVNILKNSFLMMCFVLNMIMYDMLCKDSI
mgnify:CR=1 FL=1